MSNDYLHAVRAFELNQAISEFPARGRDGGAVRVLDIGAGTGHQAAMLQSSGYEVTAVDLPVSSYAAERVFPIVDYDGRALPLADNSVDVVFSSNVLEHVPDIEALLQESRRVLVNNGVAIHILPTPAWRWWTTLGHYPWMLLRIWQLLAGRRSRRNSGDAGRLDYPGSTKRWWTVLWPERHGERGMTLTEPYYYSMHWWKATFAASGFLVEATYPTGLFYTGGMLTAERLSMAKRARIARWLGSACRIYVLRPAPGCAAKASSR